MIMNWATSNIQGLREIEHDIITIAVLTGNRRTTKLHTYI